MDLQFGDIQETALITLAIREKDTSRCHIKRSKPPGALGKDVHKSKGHIGGRHRMFPMQKMT